MLFQNTKNTQHILLDDVDSGIVSLFGKEDWKSCIVDESYVPMLSCTTFFLNG